MLPERHEQLVHGNGTLQLVAVTRDADQGTYTCTAHGRHGTTHTQHAPLTVIGKLQLAVTHLFLL